MKHYILTGGLFLFLQSVIVCQIQLLNDEFSDNASLVNWKNINLEEEWGIEQLEHYSIDDLSPGKLRMMPKTASWFGGYRGPLLYREVAGNFVFTTKIDAIGRDNPIPETDYNLAGLMIRHVRKYPNGALGASGWTPTDNNYIFLSIGAANNTGLFCEPDPGNCPGPHFEAKTTINGNSVLNIHNVDTSSTQIRVARIDDVFVVLYRLETDQTWVVHQRFQRTDFPDTLQVGFVTYTDWTKVSSYDPGTDNETQIEGDECDSGPECDPDIIGEFEFARFDSLSVPLGIGTDFTNEVDVTDAYLLGFLDFESVAYCPEFISTTAAVDSNSYQLYQSSQTLQLGNIIDENTIVKATSVVSVSLLPGFETKSGVELLVSMEGCL